MVAAQTALKPNQELAHTARECRVYVGYELLQTQLTLQRVTFKNSFQWDR